MRWPCAARTCSSSAILRALSWSRWPAPRSALPDGCMCGLHCCPSPALTWRSICIAYSQQYFSDIQHHLQCEAHGCAPWRTEAASYKRDPASVFKEATAIGNTSHHCGTVPFKHGSAQPTVTLPQALVQVRCCLLPAPAEVVVKECLDACRMLMRVLQRRRGRASRREWRHPWDYPLTSPWRALLSIPL